MKIGILALQGDYEAHAKAMNRLNVPVVLVTKPEQLDDIQGLIIPGGESTTLLNFIMQDSFFPKIQAFEKKGVIFGTCAGAILLANNVVNPAQTSLKLIDITIARNAYGRQLSSQIATGTYIPHNVNMEMVFIRAPKIMQTGQAVSVFASFEGQPVGVMEKNIMLTTFHPELTADLTLPKLFLDQCKLVASLTH